MRSDGEFRSLDRHGAIEVGAMIAQRRWSVNRNCQKLNRCWDRGRTRDVFDLCNRLARSVIDALPRTSLYPRRFI
jgi:hypothetical protein